MKRVYVSPTLKMKEVQTVYQLCQNSPSNSSVGPSEGGENGGSLGGGDNGGSDTPDGAKAFNVWGDF